jgi:hypothetical protein
MPEKRSKILKKRQYALAWHLSFIKTRKGYFYFIALQRNKIALFFELTFFEDSFSQIIYGIDIHSHTFVRINVPTEL